MVGGHNISLTLDNALFEAIKLRSYEPFIVEPTDDTLFDVEIVDSLPAVAAEPLIVDAELSSEGMPRVDVYRTPHGFRYDITMPYRNQINSSMLLDNEKHTVTITLAGDPFTMKTALDNSVILSYVSFGMKHSTLLLHASTVMVEGRAYLFLGKSGTGKSTHSQMWLKAFAPIGAELLNDDHPIVRTHDDGSIIAYGSPWSGKTPCYRNLSAPLGAIVRIERALSNTLVPLSAIKAFASITTSCSGAQWSSEMMNDKVLAIEKIVKASKGYTMRCLPNTDAAEVCYAGIKASL